MDTIITFHKVTLIEYFVATIERITASSRLEKQHIVPRDKSFLSFKGEEHNNFVY